MKAFGKEGAMMYKIMTFKEHVRITPNLFGMKINEAALKILREQYERTVDKNIGVIISLHNARAENQGKIIPGDGAAYFNVEFEGLVFMPEVNEVVEGEVSEIVEFGAFVKLGPIDGLVHVSQIANDFFSYDKKQGILVGKETKKSIKKKDCVKAKIATVSLKESIPNSKIALTMRPDGLGRTEKESKKGETKQPKALKKDGGKKESKK